MNEKYAGFKNNVYLGERICVRLKILYFPQDSWFKSYQKIGKLLSLLKKNGKKFFSVNETNELLKKLSTLPDEDIKILLEDEKK